MSHYNQRYSNPAFEYGQSYQEEFEFELSPEFEMESDNEFEQEPEFEFEQEPEFEYEPEFENGQELEYDNENEPGFEMEEQNENDQETDFEFESPQDELEAELEYVTTEGEFNKWVNKVVARKAKRLSPLLRSPLGRKAISHLSKIAFKTLPFIGRRRWHQGARGRWDKWGRRWPHRRPHYRYGANAAYPWGPYGPSWGANQGMQPQPQQEPSWGATQGMPAPPQQAPEGGQQPGFQPDMQGSPDGSFKNFVLGTLKNLSEQIARGNESLTALKNSIVSSAANNFPGIIQPKTEGQEPSAQEPANANGAAKQPEFEMGDYEYDMEAEGEVTDPEGSFNEITEMELASELLSLNNEREMDYFLDGLFKKAVGWGSKLLKSPTGSMLKKLLRKVLKKGLPALGTAAGTAFGGPIGAQVGGAVGNKASDLFELELEGLSNEDKEFEVAKVFVRFAGNLAKEANDHMTGNPQQDAHHALVQAAQRYAPGLLVNKNGYQKNRMQASGSWYRRGNKIIIVGAF